MLTSTDLGRAITRMHLAIVPIRDVLNAADRVLGDGDTGMTIEQIVSAWQDVSQALPQELGAALLALSKATMQASGSSLGAVLSMGLSAAGRSLRTDPKTALARADLVPVMNAAIETICARSGATAGAKSVLDSLLAIRDALQHPDKLEHTALQSAIEAARAALDAFRDQPSQLGRARIYGDKSIGQDDPGMLAVYLLLQAAR